MSSLDQPDRGLQEAFAAITDLQVRLTYLQDVVRQQDEVLTEFTRRVIALERALAELSDPGSPESTS